MTSLPKAKLCHFGIYARDLKKMVDFYTRVFGLVVTDWGYSTRGMDIAFLSGTPDEQDPTWRLADEWSEDLRKKEFAVGPAPSPAR
jgi:catechol 2,3-dioxygenase-like lactoylglutathione lyase family enzyme